MGCFLYDRQLHVSQLFTLSDKIINHITKVTSAFYALCLIAVPSRGPFANLLWTWPSLSCGKTILREQWVFNRELSRSRWLIKIGQVAPYRLMSHSLSLHASHNPWCSNVIAEKETGGPRQEDGTRRIIKKKKKNRNCFGQIQRGNMQSTNSCKTQSTLPPELSETRQK